MSLFQLLFLKLCKSKEELLRTVDSREQANQKTNRHDKYIPQIIFDWVYHYLGFKSFVLQDETSQGNKRVVCGRSSWRRSTVNLSNVEQRTTTSHLNP